MNSVACGVSARSDSILVSVRDEFVPGTISEDQIICYHSVPNFLSGTSCTGGDEPYQYQWEQSSDNGNTFSESAGTGSGTLLFSPDALEQTMVYRLRYTSASGCGTSYSNQLTVTVYPDIAPPVIGNSQAICYETEPQMLSISVPASGGDGSFTNRWQVRDGNEWIDISDNAGGGFQPPQLYETTDYRLTSESTYGCGSVYSNIITINVYEVLSSGAITDSQTICYNTEPSAFLFSTPPQGAGGEYTYQWQRSSDNVTFEDIPNANDAVYQSPSLSETTYFRCEVNSIICETNDYAESIEIVVLPIVVAGVIGNDQEICYNTTPSPLVVTTNSYGGDGNFRYQWQTSTDGTSFEDISFENDTIYQPQTLTQTTWYRLKFINCDTVFSNVILVLVNPLPTEKNIEGPFLVCRNASDVTYVLAQDQENIEYQWQIEGGVFTNYSEIQTIVHWDDTGNDGVITLFQIDTTTRCWLTTDYYIAKREERSPDKTNIVKKNNSSNILICQDNTENSHYQWGFVNLESNEEQFIANSDYQYVLIPHTIDTFRFKYFVDIYYGVSDVCTTRTYYPSGSTITATTDLSCLRDVYAFPIPTKNHLYIRGNNLKGKYTASFKNYLGQTLLEKKFCSDYNNDVVQLDFNLPNGFYLLVLDNGKEYKTLKIIVE